MKFLIYLEDPLVLGDALEGQLLAVVDGEVDFSEGALPD